MIVFCVILFGVPTVVLLYELVELAFKVQQGFRIQFGLTELLVIPLAFAPSFWCVVQWINGNWRGSGERSLLIAAVILFQSVGAFYGWLENRDEPESKSKSGMKSALNIFVCASASIIGSLGVGIILIIGGVLS